MARTAPSTASCPGRTRCRNVVLGAARPPGAAGPRDRQLESARRLDRRLVLQEALEAPGVPGQDGGHAGLARAFGDERVVYRAARDAQVATPPQRPAVVRAA